MKQLLIAFFCIVAQLLNAQQNDSPKLVVGVIVDQMCYEYLYRYYDKYCEGGFRKLMNEGANCRNAHYNYVPTYTGPGHASIYTGTTPENHGIVGNDWYSAQEGKEVNCVEDLEVSTVGSASKYGKYSPKRLKTLTITDQLKITYPDAQVVSMSIKNRGAILPGGHISDGSYWFDYVSGDMISSTFYTDKLPDWVSDFNAENYPESVLKGKWETIMDINDYAESGIDNSPYEHLLPGKETPTFPYDLKKMDSTGKNYNLFTSTPMANTYLTSFAIKALENELLGRDGQTDMLCVSYSTPDIIGHSFGPYSIEIEDTYLRLDLEIKRLLNKLDEVIGEGEYTLFLTADHAVVPVPQFYIDNKLPGGYVFLDPLMDELKVKLNNCFGFDPIVTSTNLNIYLNDTLIQKNKLSNQEVASFIQQEVRNWENVKRVYTADELMDGSYDDIWKMKVKQGFHPKESGDLVLVLEPGFLPKHIDTETSRKGTSHGSAYAYDSHVPLLFFGKGIENKEILKECEITDIVPTLSQLLYIQNPSSVTGKVLLDVLKN